MQDKPCSMSENCALAGQCQQDDGTLRRKCKRPFITVGEITVGAALACYMAWVSMSFKSLNLFAVDGTGEEVLDTIYLVSIIILTCTLLFAGIYKQGTERFLSTNYRCIFCPFLWLPPRQA